MTNFRKILFSVFGLTALGAGVGYGSTLFDVPSSTVDSGGSTVENETQTKVRTEVDLHEAGSTFETTVTTDGVGDILVQVELPEEARYEEGAPVVVNVPTFYTPDTSGFHPLEELTDRGVISISLMYPGRSDGNGRSSEGDDDFGGEDSIKALKDVLLFAMDKKENSDGFTLSELSAVQPIPSNVGIYAFSHPGIAATIAMADYADELEGLAFFVGRENPTQDIMSPLELGYWEEEGKVKVPVLNPLYDPATDYSDTFIKLDYSDLRYDMSDGRPYLDSNGNNRLDTGEYAMGKYTPKMLGKYYYSIQALHALEDNGVFTANTWPKDLATPEEADVMWSTRQTISYYPKLSTLSSLHVMLVFAQQDHVQSAKDKPHIHQAYDGFRSAGLWTRLNPDSSYFELLSEEAAAAGRKAAPSSFEDHDANDEPVNWEKEVGEWAYANSLGGIAPMASLLEMMDRTRAKNWSENLSGVLQN